MKGADGGRGISEDNRKDVGAEACKELVENVTGEVKEKNGNWSILP